MTIKEAVRNAYELQVDEDHMTDIFQMITEAPEEEIDETEI